MGLDENGRYPGSVAENLPPGAEVITVTATDKDEFPDFKKVEISSRVSTTPGNPGNPGNLLEFKNPPGNLLEFNGPPGNFCVRCSTALVSGHNTGYQMA